MSNNRPLVPEDIARAPRSETLMRNLTRAAHALWQANGLLGEVSRSARDDPAIAQLLGLQTRAAVTIASTSSLTQLSQSTIDYLRAVFTPASAIGAVIERATRLTFDRDAAVWSPGIATDAGSFAFLGQGAVMRVRQFDLSNGVSIVPLKAGFATVLSNELLRDSNAETVIRTKMMSDMRKGAEDLLLDATAGTAIRPPGLRAGVSAETASSDTGDTGMSSDLSLICAKTAAVDGLASTIIIASPKQALRIWSRMPWFKVPTFASASLADKIVMAVACAGVAFAGSPEAPRLDLSGEGVLVMDDATPGEFATGAGVIGAPARSLWQSDCRCLRLLADCAWQPRATSGICSWVQNVAWG
jgi:hypothetical protein